MDTQDILAQLETSVRELHGAGSPDDFARELARLAATLDRQASTLLAAQAQAGDTPEAALHRRALHDHAALQSQLAQVRAPLFDRAAFEDMLRRKGDDLDCLRRSLAFTGAMDLALQHLIHLMQYDTPERHEVDIRNGFQFSSGSTQYQRFYFAPPRGDRGQ